MISNLLNTDPVLSVPNATGVPNVLTVPNVPKMAVNDTSVPKSYLVYQQKQCTNQCTKCKVWQSEPNVPKLTRHDAQCTKHWCTKVQLVYQT